MYPIVLGEPLQGGPLLTVSPAKIRQTTYNCSKDKVCRLEPRSFPRLHEVNIPGGEATFLRPLLMRLMADVIYVLPVQARLTNIHPQAKIKKTYIFQPRPEVYEDDLDDPALHAKNSILGKMLGKLGEDQGLWTGCFAAKCNDMLPWLLAQCPPRSLLLLISEN